jgi:hypothetical protein
MLQGTESWTPLSNKKEQNLEIRLKLCKGKHCASKKQRNSFFSHQHVLLLFESYSIDLLSN